MRGLILKDLYVSFKYCRAFLLIVTVFIMVSIFGNNNLFFMLYPAVIVSTVPITLISCDEKENWLTYSLALPYSKKQIVSSKYIVGLFYNAVVLVLIVLAQIIKEKILMQTALIDIRFLTVISAAFSLISPAIILPFIFRFGSEKGRMLYWAVIILMCAFSVGSMSGFGNLFNAETYTSEAVIAEIFIICSAVILYVISWMLSVIAYKKREL